MKLRGIKDLDIPTKKKPTAHLWTQTLPSDSDDVTYENKSKKWNEIFPWQQK